MKWYLQIVGILHDAWKHLIHFLQTVHSKCKFSKIRAKYHSNILHYLFHNQAACIELWMYSGNSHDAQFEDKYLAAQMTECLTQKGQSISR